MEGEATLPIKNSPVYFPQGNLLKFINCSFDEILVLPAAAPSRRYAGKYDQFELGLLIKKVKHHCHRQRRSALIANFFLPRIAAPLMFAQGFIAMMDHLAGFIIRNFFKISVVVPIDYLFTMHNLPQAS